MSKKKKEPKKWTKIFLLIINFILIIALLISYLSPYINPEKNYIPALFGLIYPALFILNTFFVIWWIIKWKKYFLFSLISILLGWNLFFKNVQFNEAKPVNNYSDAIKLISYNVRLFDQYKWTGNQNYFTRNNIYSLIKSEQADVICFQEFFHGNDRYFPTIGPFLELQQKIKYYHVDFVETIGENKHFGIATFSVYPIVNKGEIHFDNSSTNSGIFVDIVFKEDTIRIFNFHLESIRFSKADYQYVSDPVFHNNNYQSGSSVIVWKLKTAFKKRAKQARLVAEEIKKSPYPVIVCGDFNDTPVSYTYHIISENLNDAFLESGSGLGSTYAGDLPFLRIDYIFSSPVLESYKFKKIVVNYSDHYPISCYFKIRPEKN